MKHQQGLFHSETGSTLIFLIIGMGITSVLGLFIGHMAVAAKKVENSSDITNELNQMHIRSISKTRKLDSLKESLTASGLNLEQDSALSKCLVGAGTGCEVFQGEDRFVEISGLRETFFHSSGGNLTSQIFYKLHCPTTTLCDSIELRINTQNLDGNLSRKTDLRVGGVFLSHGATMTFDCVGTDSNIVTGLDYARKQAVCQGIPISSGCGGTPISDLDAGSNPTCATMASVSCPQGIRQVGLMESQESCL